jgi:hypothetical protein
MGFGPVDPNYLSLKALSARSRNGLIRYESAVRPGVKGAWRTSSGS